MFSTTADHALRAVLFLAQQPGRVASSDEIAQAIGAPRNYLSKTLYELRKAGVVESVAGRQGGFLLAVPGDRLSIADVVDHFEAPPESARCLLGDRPCDAKNPCVAHEKWASITESYRVALEETTIADLLAGTPRPRRR